MRGSQQAEVTQRLSPASMRSRLNLLIGDRRRMIVQLSGASILCGFTEAAILTLVADIAASLVAGHESHKNSHGVVALINLHASTGTLIAIAAGLCHSAAAVSDPAVGAARADCRRRAGQAAQRTV